MRKNKTQTPMDRIGLDSDSESDGDGVNPREFDYVENVAAFPPNLRHTWVPRLGPKANFHIWVRIMRPVRI